MEGDWSVEARNPKEFFEKILPNKFKPDKAKGVEVIVQVNIRGAGGGTWTVTIKDQKIQTKQGTQSSPTLAIDITQTDYMDIVNGKMSAEKAFFSGKIQFKGNIAVALRLKEMGFL